MATGNMLPVDSDTDAPVPVCIFLARPFPPLTLGARARSQNAPACVRACARACVCVHVALFHAVPAEFRTHLGF